MDILIVQCNGILGDYDPLLLCRVLATYETNKGIYPELIQVEVNRIDTGLLSNWFTSRSATVFKRKYINRVLMLRVIPQQVKGSIIFADIDLVLSAKESREYTDRWKREYLAQTVYTRPVQAPDPVLPPPPSPAPPMTDIPGGPVKYGIVDPGPDNTLPYWF